MRKCLQFAPFALKPSGRRSVGMIRELTGRLKFSLDDDLQSLHRFLFSRRLGELAGEFADTTIHSRKDRGESIRRRVIPDRR